MLIFWIYDILGKGIVISIDIDRTNLKAKHKRIVTLTGNSLSNKVIDSVFDLYKNKRVLVIHDGAHSRERVLMDLRNYGRFVSKGSYLIVEDGIIDLFNPGDGIGSHIDGPYKAVCDFLKENANFIVDKEKERYITTYNPRGFLKRIQ